MTDWNWFFSTFAQCFAAIVGFLGGFVINKIIGRDGDFALLQRELETAINRIQEQKERLLSRYFDWYNARRRDSVTESEEFGRLILRGIGAPNTDELVRSFEFSPFDNLNELRELINSSYGASLPKSGERFFSTPTPRTIHIPNPHVTEERDLISGEMVSTKRLMDDLIGLKDRLEAFPKGAGAILPLLFAISILFFVGVIYPLHFLPSQAEPVLAKITELPSVFLQNMLSLRGLLLTIVSIAFLGIVAYFIGKNYGQTFAQSKLQLIKEHMSLGSYSEYFANYEKMVDFWEKTKPATQ